MVDNSDRFYIDPDNVRKVELVHQPPPFYACVLATNTSEHATQPRPTQPLFKLSFGPIHLVVRKEITAR
jgi:hypothetical protein